MEGMPEAEASLNFLDVPADEWFAKAVCWATETGIVNGYSTEAFGPSDPMTREQLAAILYRYAAYRGINPAAEHENPLEQYADADLISDWAADAFAWLIDAGIINGVSEDRLSPRTEATRAQTATLLMRFCVAFEDMIEFPLE